MPDKPISFKRMKQALDRMGFVSVSREGQVAFFHDVTDTVVMFPERTTSVSTMRIESLRRILTGRGVVTEEQYDELVAGGKSRTSVA